MPSRPVVLGVLAAAPAGIVTLALLAFAGRELSGSTPMSYGPPRNIAEAALSGQAADVLRFLRSGQDPARVWPMRREVSRRLARATALDAAVWSGRGPLVAMLDRAGAIPDAETRRHMACLASDLPAGEVVAYFAARGSPQCEPGQALALVRARSRQPG